MEINVRREIKFYLLLPAWHLLSAASPVNISRRNPVLVLKDPPKPDHRRDLVFRQPHNFPLQIPWFLNPFLRIDKYTGMTENLEVKTGIPTNLSSPLDRSITYEEKEDSDMSMFHSINRGRKGFLLLEVLVSVAVIAIGLVYVVKSFSSSSRATPSK